uniref:Uncharacterized protein n=1 Tax=Anguilla anguilla TaxID=7936 RepID=A0A0E9T577_ANGAN
MSFNNTHCSICFDGTISNSLFMVR